MGILEPKGRLRLLEQFRPPEGFKLNRAVGTTFSLDLLSLLMAPLAMVMFEHEDKDETLKDPTAILEALRLTTDRIAVFCQKGRIAIPQKENYLFSYLEPMVVEVELEDPIGVFHPKVWLLRYVGEKQAIFYRFLCLSRNLTFDQSWDTILNLEGKFDSIRQNTFSRNRPLSDFVSFLPDLGNNVPSSIRKNIRVMAQEILKVKLEPPEPFDDDIKFYPIGIPGYKKGPELAAYDKALIISPFLSEDIVKPLVEEGTGNVLISRTESFDNLDRDLLKRMARKVGLYTMETDAEKPPSNEGEDMRDDVPITEDDPTGLHAKLYILESGWNASVWTGSANATSMGLNGRNVEFLTQLVGKKSKVGIDILLGKGKDAPEMSLRDLLIQYKIPEVPMPNDDIRKKLEKKLEDARRLISRTNLLVKISAVGDGKYCMELVSKGKVELPSGTTVVCWPVMLPEAYGMDLSSVASGGLFFSGVTLLALTRFFAFKVVAKEGDKEAVITFVINLPVEGMPEDRNNQILQHIIGNSERFIRYLLFLLSEDPAEVMLDQIIRGATGRGDGNGECAVEIPLLEELVRAYSRHPEKLRRVDALMTDIKKSAGGGDVIPKGFDDIWSVFRETLLAEGKG